MGLLWGALGSYAPPGKRNGTFTEPVLAPIGSFSAMHMAAL